MAVFRAPPALDGIGPPLQAAWARAVPGRDAEGSATAPNARTQAALIMHTVARPGLPRALALRVVCPLHPRSSHVPSTDLARLPGSCTCRLQTGGADGCIRSARHDTCPDRSRNRATGTAYDKQKCCR